MFLRVAIIPQTVAVNRPGSRAGPYQAETGAGTSTPAG
jgi:hypothetical protein